MIYGKLIFIMQMRATNALKIFKLPRYLMSNIEGNLKTKLTVESS